MSEPNAQEPVEPQTPVEGDPSGGTQPASEPAQEPNPSPETTGSQTPSIPKPRFDEVIQERNRLRDELARYQQPTQPQQPMQPDPNREPVESDYPDYGTFLRAQMRYEARQEVRQQTLHQQAATQVQNAWRNVQQKAMDEGQKDPSAYDLPQVLGQFQNPAIALAIAEAPDNTDILRYFRANPQEIARLQYQTPYQQLMELGRIQARLAGSKGQPPKVSQMPAPMAPVGAGKVGGKVDGKYTQEEVLAKLYGAA